MRMCNTKTGFNTLVSVSLSHILTLLNFHELTLQNLTEKCEIKANFTLILLRIK
jgi:hypothetical protein